MRQVQQAIVAANKEIARRGLPPANPEKPTNQPNKPSNPTVVLKTWGSRQFEVKGDGTASYEVKGGDTLWSISQDVLRNKLGRHDTGNAKGTGTHLHSGVGNSIISGTGPEGGVGSGFDAVALLNEVLQNTRHQIQA